MKDCTVCGKHKPKNDYFYRNKRTEKLHSQCKQCYINKRRATWKSYYHKHGSKYRERAVERNRKIKSHLRNNFLKYFEDKFCANCGVNDPRVLEFHHIDPATKSFGIARAITSTMAWDKVLVEINKCQILCANCHKIETSDKYGWYTSRAAS